ncbi:DUF2892 domain-containing protein [Beggiatoa alba]|nr:DUF2892 domain-containing protein [bacterium AH-315-E07]MBN4082021.1 DUF2892 domain-containing protein [Beggiatoa alba]
MNKNVGSIDKVLRIIIALAVFGAGFYYQSWWGLVGLVPLLTALVNWCPLYSLIGIKTCSTTPKLD